MLPDIELVIARFEEDLSWVRRVPPSIRVRIFNKGASAALPPDFMSRCEVEVAVLPNVGREAHSYLTHLAGRYRQVSPVTIFCQGHPFDHAPDFHKRLRAVVEGKEVPNPFLWYGFLDDSDDPLGERLFVPWSKNKDHRRLPTGLLYAELFGERSPDLFCFRGGAQFAVAAGGVHRRPLEFYQRALECSVSVPDAAHCFERMWDRIFGKPMISPASLAPDGIRYHKRIRRLESLQDGSLEEYR